MKRLVTLGLQQLSPCQCENQGLQLLDQELVRKLDQTPTAGNYSSHETYLHDKRKGKCDNKGGLCGYTLHHEPIGSMEIKVDRYKWLASQSIIR